MSLPNLTNEFIADSYRGVLHTSNQPVTGTSLNQVYDGLGNATSLKISSETIQVGNLVFPTSGTLGQALVINSSGNLEFNSMFPIGAVYFTTTDTNPSTFLGGVWNRIAQGRFIVGVGTGTDGTYSRTITTGNNSGQYEHLLTEDEMPNHTHSLIEPFRNEQFYLINDRNTTHGTDSDAGVFRADGPAQDDDARYLNKLPSTGGSLPHNNTPPGFGLFVWSRTA